MTTPFSYSKSYTLDKSYFAETFDESYVLLSMKARYAKSCILSLIGAILLFTEVSPYVAWFFVALGAIEALSVRFRRSWWLARQMLSRAANSELTLTIDESGVSSKSFYVESTIAWDDVDKMAQTKQGWLLYHGGGKSYISSRYLSTEAQEFITKKAHSKI